MGQFLGFVDLDGTLVSTHLVRNSSQSPVAADALPTFRVYGPSGLMTNGTGTMSKKDSGSITGASNASPIVITSAGHKLATGTRVKVAGVGGNTNANTTADATVIDANTFSLAGTTGNGVYTSGGTWEVAGLYGFSIDALATNGYTKGETYSVLVSAEVSATPAGDLHTFTVT